MFILKYIPQLYKVNMETASKYDKMIKPFAKYFQASFFLYKVFLPILWIKIDLQKSSSKYAVGLFFVDSNKIFVHDC